jgi:omega-6 fatty acid desaturase (delta-12 desaturase)
VLQWFTGNIGLHHIHHIRPRIPNYNLQQAYDEVDVFQAVKSVTIRRSLKSLWMNLWDEEQQKLVSFWSLRARTSAP